jgi:transposase
MHVLLLTPCTRDFLNPLNAELNPVCHLLALLGAHHILHVSRKRVKQLILPQLLKRFHALYGIHRVVTELTGDSHLSLF